MTQATYQTRFRASLQWRERQILVMRDSDELTPAEIGLVLDLSAWVVESLLLGLKHRARSFRNIERTNGGVS